MCSKRVGYFQTSEACGWGLQVMGGGKSPTGGPEPWVEQGLEVNKRGPSLLEGFRWEALQRERSETL